VRSGYGCGHCEACARWEPRHCPKRGGTYGYTDVNKPPYIWGGYAEHMYLSPYSVVKKMDPRIPAGVAVEQAEDAIHALAGHVPGVNPIYLAIVPGAPRVTLPR
jgi:threonine dehydrogenase-like Zn-dependent dehydrogenase